MKESILSGVVSQIFLDWKVCRSENDLVLQVEE